MTLRQLTLWPEAWWQQIERWRIRHSVSSVQRPVEDEAFDNLYYQAMALRRGDYRGSLNHLERIVYDLDIQARRYHPAYATDHERATWVASQLPGKVSGPRHVQAILREIDRVIHAEGYLQAAIAARTKWQAARLVVMDVVAEQVALQEMAA